MFAKFLRSSLVVGTLALAACGGGVCGDGAIDAENADGVAELCDDGNAIPNDGCNAVCNKVDTGFECNTPGQACDLVFESLGCADGIDNDSDGQIDCDDAVDCGTADACQELICDDGIDDNNNGQIDCQDAQCVGNDACIELQCADGLDDDADNLIDCEDGDCLFSQDCVAAGDGFHTPGLEQCDDGNLVDGDGCSANMTLEGLSTITVVASAATNNLNADDAKFSVFVPFVNQFDLDNDNVAETNLLMVVTSSRATICNDMLLAANDDGNAANGTVGPFNTIAAFGGKIIGTTVVSFVQTSDVQFGVGTFAGVGAPPLTKIVQANGQAGPGEIFTEAGFITLDAQANALQDTTFASDGFGVINITDFAVEDRFFTGLENVAGDPIAVPTGNIELDFTNVNMLGQFISNNLDQDLDGRGRCNNNAATTCTAATQTDDCGVGNTCINFNETKKLDPPAPISGVIKAATCGFTFFF